MLEKQIDLKAYAQTKNVQTYKLVGLKKNVPIKCKRGNLFLSFMCAVFFAAIKVNRKL